MATSTVCFLGSGVSHVHALGGLPAAAGLVVARRAVKTPASAVRAAAVTAEAIRAA